MSENIKSNSRRWLVARWILIGLACVATLIVVGYTVEDIRGKRAWEARKAELEAQGLKMDWSAHIPAPVPDEQNFYKAPGIVEADWVGRGARGLGVRLSKILTNTMSQFQKPVELADFVVAPSDRNANGEDVKLDLQDEGSRAVEKAIRAESGSYLLLAGSLNTFVIAKPQGEIKPVKFWVSSTNGPGWPAILSAFPAILSVTNRTGDNLVMSLDVSMISATDYLRATETIAPDLDAIREALKRPYAYMAGDYRIPYMIPIQNFVLMRSLGQLLADRAKCHLLLNQPDKALEELTLINDVCRVLESRPSGGPMTLVAAMINVAMHGLYEAVEEGLQLHAWQPAQLAALQEQCENIHLLPLLADAFQTESVASSYTLEHSMDELTARKIFQSAQAEHLQSPFVEIFKDPFYRFCLLAPHGLIYENMVNYTKLTSPIDGFDRSSGQVFPARYKQTSENIATVLRAKSLNTYLIEVFLPNSLRAWLRGATVQTLLNETAVACALERYRLARGEYPVTLDALTPEFMKQVPNDIIGGEPLKYRRQKNGTFLLYSIGWNERDDGGNVVRKGTEINWEEGDWVWGASRWN